MAGAGRGQTSIGQVAEALSRPRKWCRDPPQRRSPSAAVFERMFVPCSQPGTCEAGALGAITKSKWSRKISERSAIA